MTVSFGIHTSKVRVFICQTFLHKRICANVRNLILSRPIICAYTNFDHWRRLRLPDWRLYGWAPKCNQRSCDMCDCILGWMFDRHSMIYTFLVYMLWHLFAPIVCVLYRSPTHPSVRRDVRKILLYIGQHSRSRFGFDYNLSAIHIYSLVWSKSG